MHDKYYHEVVNNLTSIQKQAQALLDKIQKSADQYDATLKKLGQINESINFLWDVTIKIRFEVEQRLAWLTNCLGSSGKHVIVTRINITNEVILVIKIKRFLFILTELILY